MIRCQNDYCGMYGSKKQVKKTVLQSPISGKIYCSMICFHCHETMTKGGVVCVNEKWEITEITPDMVVINLLAEKQ